MELTEAQKPSSPWDNPSLWRMYCEISDKSIRAVFRGLSDETAFATLSISYDTGINPRALEEAVYATPQLLADYQRVHILIRTDRYTSYLPAPSDEEIRAVAEGTKLISDNPDIALCDKDEDTSIIWAMPEERYNFLRRTFPTARIEHHISPLLRYFSHKSTFGNHGKTFVHLCSEPASQSDIIVYDRNGQLSLAVSKDTPAIDDATYYALACSKVCGNTPVNDEILVCGDRSRRMPLISSLRRFVAQVVPVIFPSSAFRAGATAMDAPFNLIITSLCE